MSYSDEDILDLYEDLHAIGLSETPEEEAERHRLAAIKHVTSSLNLPPNLTLLKYCIEKAPNCTYLLLVRENPLLAGGSGKPTTAVYPVVRGQVLTTAWCKSVESYTLQVQSKVNQIHHFLTLDDLKVALLQAKEEFPEISLKKYDFLNLD